MPTPESMHHQAPEVAATDETLHRAASHDLGASAVGQLVTVPGELAEIGKNWRINSGTGELEQKIDGALRTGETAQRLLAGTDEQLDDSGLAQVAAVEVDDLLNDAATATRRIHGELQHVLAIPRTDINAENLGRVQAQLQTRLDASLRQPQEFTQHPQVVDALASEITSRERVAIEARAEAIVEADKLPWTMPNVAVSPQLMEVFKIKYDDVIEQETPALPDDIFAVEAPVASDYDPMDLQLLEAAGVTDRRRFKRADLQRAGVFFVNRVGAGEQPIFDGQIPDPDNETGTFNVGNRSLLTREEFEKVYAYQQENGYGIGDADAKDVQLDMLMFAMSPDARRAQSSKGASFGSRENKYNQMRSPFVDLGYVIKGSVETYVRDRDEGKNPRINTLVVHLVNAHPDYPGVSEMSRPETAPDQEYMTAGAFVEKYYAEPTEPEEAFRAAVTGEPTRRERLWVGAWPEEPLFA